MQPWQIIIGSIVTMIAIVLIVYISFTARCKGPIFSNTYIWLSKQEQENIDKKAEYRLVTIVFGCLALVFLSLALYIFTLWRWPYVLMWIFISFDIIYAFIDAVKK